MVSVRDPHSLYTALRQRHYLYNACEASGLSFSLHRLQNVSIDRCLPFAVNRTHTSPTGDICVALTLSIFSL
jgi:hypothetical protein